MGAKKMEVPRGFEPRVEDLQSFALPTWLWNQLEDFNTLCLHSQPKKLKITARVSPRCGCEIRNIDSVRLDTKK